MPYLLSAAYPATTTATATDPPTAATSAAADARAAATSVPSTARNARYSSALRD